MSTTDPYAPCPCGSGKKYKFCCMEKDRAAARAAKEEQDKKDAAERKAKGAAVASKPHEQAPASPASKKIFRGSQRGS